VANHHDEGAIRVMWATALRRLLLKPVAYVGRKFGVAGTLDEPHEQAIHAHALRPRLVSKPQGKVRWHSDRHHRHSN